MTVSRSGDGRDDPAWEDLGVPARFMTLADVAESLSVSAAQAYALVRSGELPAIKVGGRGQWRVEISVLEDYIQGKYAETRAMVASPAADDEDALLG